MQVIQVIQVILVILVILIIQVILVIQIILVILVILVMKVILVIQVKPLRFFSSVTPYTSTTHSSKIRWWISSVQSVPVTALCLFL
jgi:hypothetical protein